MFEIERAEFLDRWRGTISDGFSLPRQRKREKQKSLPVSGYHPLGMLVIMQEQER